MATNNQYYLEKILESLKELQSFMHEEFERARLKSNPKRERKVLICGYTEAEDCFCVATEIMKSEYDLDVADVEFSTNLTGLPVASKVFDRSPERKLDTNKEFSGKELSSMVNPRESEYHCSLKSTLIVPEDSITGNVELINTSQANHIVKEAYYQGIKKCSHVLENEFVKELSPKPPDDYRQLIHCGTYMNQGNGDVFDKRYTRGISNRKVLISGYNQDEDCLYVETFEYVQKKLLISGFSETEDCLCVEIYEDVTKQDFMIPKENEIQSTPPSKEQAEGGSSQHTNLHGDREIDEPDWEHESVPTQSSTEDHQEDKVNSVTIEFEASLDSAKRKAICRPSAEYKELVELVHKVLIEAALLSLIPSQFLEILKVSKLTATILSRYAFSAVTIDEMESFALIFDPGGGIISTFSSFRLHHNSHVQNSLILMLMERVLMSCYSSAHSLYDLNFLSCLGHILVKISRIAMVYTSMVLGYTGIGVRYDYKAFQIIGYNKEELKIDQNMYAPSHSTFVVTTAYGYEKRTINKCRKQKLIFDSGGGIKICSFLGCVVNSSFYNLTIDQDPHIQRILACMLADRCLMSSYSLVSILAELSLMGSPRKNFIEMMDTKSSAAFFVQKLFIEMTQWNHIAWKTVKSGYCGKVDVLVFDPSGEKFHDNWFKAQNILSFCSLGCFFRYIGYAQCGKVREPMVVEYSWWSFDELPRWKFFRTGLWCQVTLKKALQLLVIILLLGQYGFEDCFVVLKALVAGGSLDLIQVQVLVMKIFIYEVIIPIFAITISIFVSFSFAAMYGIAVAAIRMLSTIATGLAIDAAGNTSDNAEMAGMSHRICEMTDTLDAAGNTIAAIRKGFAIGSATLVSLALFGAYVCRETISTIDILTPKVFIGLFIGAMLPYWFFAMTIKSVGSAALKMVEEVRRQFNTITGPMEGHAKPDYVTCVKSSIDAIERMLEDLIVQSDESATTKLLEPNSTATQSLIPEPGVRENIMLRLDVERVASQ